MVAENPDRAPTFNWTEEEKALLRRTLRVRLLEEERLEVETIGEFARDLRSTLLGHGGGFVVLALLTFATTRVGPQGLEVPPLVLATWPWFAAGMSIVLSLPLLPRRASPPLTLFPGTPWCIGHGSLQETLNLLEPASAEILARMGGAPAIPFCRSPDGVWLRTRFAASDGEKLRCRDLIVERCNVLTVTPTPLPASVARLVDPEIARTPRDVYNALRRHLNLVSLTSDTLVLRGGHSSWIWVGVVILVDSLFPIGATLVPGWANEDYHFVLGDAASAPFWQIALLVLPWIPAIAQSALVFRYYMRKRDGTITFSKRQDYVLWRKQRREVRIPTRECTLSAGRDPWESDETLSLSSVFLYHGKRLVARWVLEDYRPSDQLAKALEAKVREYLDRPGG